MKKFLTLLALLPTAVFAQWVIATIPDPYDNDVAYYMESGDKALSFYCETSASPYVFNVNIPVLFDSPFAATITLRVDEGTVFDKTASCYDSMDPRTYGWKTVCQFDDDYTFFDAFIGYMEVGYVLNWTISDNGPFNRVVGDTSLIDFDEVSALMPCFP